MYGINMKRKIAKPVSTEHSANLFTKAARKFRNKQGLTPTAKIAATNTAAQLRLIRFQTTQILNEMGITSRLERKYVHQAVQGWKRRQMQSFYTTGLKKVDYAIAGEYNKIIDAFKNPADFDRFMQILARIGDKTTANMKAPSKNPVFGKN